MADTLPAVRVNWSQITPGGGETFVQYNIYRRPENGAAEDWVRIGIVSAIATVSYTDYHTPGIVVEYAVTWTAVVSGDSLESSFPSPVDGSVTMRDCWVHAKNDTSKVSQLTQQSVTIQETLAIRFVQPWNRRAPTAHVGKKQSAVIQVTASDTWHDNRAMWDELLAVITEQIANADIMVVRHRGETYFCSAPAISRDDSIPNPFVAGAQFTEVYFDEGV